MFDFEESFRPLSGSYKVQSCPLRAAPALSLRAGSRRKISSGRRPAVASARKRFFVTAARGNRRKPSGFPVFVPRGAKLLNFQRTRTHFV